MRHAWLIPVIAGIVLLALLPFLSPYLQDLVVKIAIYAVFALSLELLVGVTGLVSLGHAAFLGIGAYVTVLASGDSGGGLLSHGGQRQLEIAMCLATNPRVLLLDEPLAGMGAEETERMLALLGELKRSHAVLLVEHDMGAVFRVADRITVMVNGPVIASDVPGRIRTNPEVLMAYLGEGH